ncbi:DUF6262 family protein [Tsukamurella paurometabola]|uniref:Transposase n=1 Tax=Tsukamurella paurometabola TaxID=2061 RepID=A0A3P8K1E7_TSUPA|nr:DUF6262 family protein [Tsukamurella paurometabola]UEA81853.1 DUF6262 family protein [Tsukamurella paurometabola]VDR38874.1 Uncharacterised protein [Tsukamurella paurometabola]
MTANEASLTALADSAASRSEESRRSIEKALKQMRRDGEAISVAAVARRAGLARATVYRHEKLLEKIHRQRRTARAPDRPAGGSAVAGPPQGAADPDAGVIAGMHLRLRHKDAKIAELTRRIKQLESTIARLHGEIDDLSPD